MHTTTTDVLLKKIKLEKYVHEIWLHIFYVMVGRNIYCILHHMGATFGANMTANMEPIWSQYGANMEPIWE